MIERLDGMKWVALALALAGCAFETAGTEDTGGELAERAQPAHEALKAACDPLKSDGCCDGTRYESCYLEPSPADSKIKIKIYNCLTTAPARSRDAFCKIEPGWTVIGGGAKILDVNAGEAVLHGSSPTGDLRTNRTWGSSSTDINGEHPHRLAPFAIGMKMEGYDNASPATLAPIHESYSGWPALTESPHAAVRVPENNVLLGGGFETGSPQKMFIIDAYATAMLNGTWVVNGSNRGNGIKESVQGIAISVDFCPSLWGSTCFKSRKFVYQDSSVGTGVRAAFAVNPNEGYFTTGVGFMSSQPNRPVWFVFPLSYENVSFGGGAAATWGSKSGYVTTQALTLRR